MNRIRARSRRPALLAILGVVLLCAACGTTSSTEPDVIELDFSEEAAYYAHEPRTILVLPAMNDTTAADAPRLFMSTIAKPLIDRGYYVIPPELASEILRAEGIYEADAWEVRPEKFYEYFGADAILYTHIRDWDTKYVVVASSVAVSIDYKLVDARTAQTLWEDEEVVVRQSGDAVRVGGDAITWLIISTIDSTITALTTDYVSLATQANTQAVGSLYPGFYNPEHAQLMKQLDAWKSK